MASLAHFVVRFRFFVVAAWLIVAAVVVPRAARVDEALQASGQSLRETESEVVKQLMLENFQRPTVSFMVVVIVGPTTIDSLAYHRLLTTLADVAVAQPYVDQVVSFLTTSDPAMLSPDRTTTFFLATLGNGSSANPGHVTPDFRRAIHEAAARTPDAAGFQIFVTGNPALDYDSREVTAEEAKRAEINSLVPAAGVLVLAFGALLAAVLPIVVGVFAISCALAAVQVAAAFHPMSVFVLTIVTMIGLAVGIDYSLLIVTRFREEMNRGQSSKEAAVRTMRTAGKAVVTSGLTVMVGFATLLLTPIIETRSVGIGGLLVVTAAVMLAITLLPAGLAILGRAIDWPRWLARRLAWYHKPTAWEHWARWLSNHPARALAIGLFIAAVISAPLVRIQIGLPIRGWFPEGTESNDGAEAMERIGSVGALLPIRILLQSPHGTKVVSSRSISGLLRLTDSLMADPRIAAVRGPVNLGTRMSRLAYIGLYGDLDRARERYPDFFETYVSRDGRTTLVDATLADTTSYIGGMDVVRRVRGLAAGGIPGLDSVDIRVGGFFAASLDLQDDLLGRFPMVIALVLGVTAVMLLIAFRSLLVPIKAVVMNLLSVTGAFGLLVLVFQDGFGVKLFGIDGATEAVYVVIPVLVFALVFGLSMDYEVFLLSRMKEAFDRTHKNDLATMEGLSVTASVITSAAAIMIIVFGAFAFSRVLAAKMLGFGLAVAVFLDATLIRMVLVPAFMHIAGRWNWWPGVPLPPDPQENPDP